MKILVIDDERSVVLDFLANYVFLVARSEEPRFAPLIMPTVHKMVEHKNTKSFNRKMNTYRIPVGSRVPVSGFKSHRLRSRR
jgi:hypothetical protein